MVEVEIVSRALGTHSVVVDDEFADLARSCCLDLRGRNILYARMNGNGRRYLHRVIAGAGPGTVVDHINGNGLDNRLSNLRVVSQQLNTRNMRARGWVRAGKGYVASLCISGPLRFPGDIGHEEDRARLSRLGVAIQQRLSANGKFRLSCRLSGKVRKTEDEARYDYEQMKLIHHGVIGIRKRG